MLQKNVLFSGTVRDNLRWGDPGADDETLWAACRAACADEFLERMPGGLDADLGQGGVNVSGGQKQRLCIARTLLKHPKVLIFDDSTSAVDTATEAKIRKALRALPDVTKIIIAQRITSVMGPTRSSCWRTAASMRWAPTANCWPATRFIRRSIIPR